MDLEKSTPLYETYIKRSWRGFDVGEFGSTLQMSQLSDLEFIIASQTYMETMALSYNTVVTDIFEGLDPPVETTRRKPKPDLWFDEDCRRTKGTVRKLERRYKKTNQAHDRAAWIAAVRRLMPNKTYIGMRSSSRIFTTIISTSVIERNSSSFLLKC